MTWTASKYAAIKCPKKSQELAEYVYITNLHAGANAVAFCCSRKEGGGEDVMDWRRRRVLNEDSDFLSKSTRNHRHGVKNSLT